MTKIKIAKKKLEDIYKKNQGCLEKKLNIDITKSRLSSKNWR